MTDIFKLLIAFFLIATVPVALAQQGGNWSTGGHIKAQVNHVGFPDNSIYRQWSGSSAQDYNLESRVKFAYRENRWDFNADY